MRDFRQIRITTLILILCACLSQLASAQTSGQLNSPTSTSTTGQSALAEADKLNAQVVKLYGAGKFDEALPLAERVLAIREKELGIDSKPVAVALTNLGAIYFSQAKYGKSEEAYQRALTIYEKLQEGDSDNSARILDSLALLYYKRENPAKTEELYLRALAIREKLFGNESAEFAGELYSLALFYSATENYKKAEQYFQRLTEINEKLPESARRAYAALKFRYACVLRKEGKPDEAKRVEIGDSEDARAGEDKVKPVRGGVINGRAISLPKPAYPSTARGAHVSGTVAVQVMIDETGKVIFACAISGHPLLQPASEYAAMSARFTPTSLEGKPVKVTGVIVYNFVAQ
jgi:tetratricopeptide (TPR) repeat protein